MKSSDKRVHSNVGAVHLMGYELMKGNFYEFKDNKCDIWQILS